MKWLDALGSHLLELVIPGEALLKDEDIDVDHLTFQIMSVFETVTGSNSE